MNINIIIILVVLVAGILGFLGALLLLWKSLFVKKISFLLLSFAIGAMLGVVFFDFIPESFELLDIHLAAILMLFGIIFSFIIEKFILAQHCHRHIDNHNDECRHSRLKSSVPLIIVGDFFHNFMDGVLIAAAFLTSIPLGIAATIAEIAHEIPQEIGDFSIMIASGMKKSKVLFWNIMSEIGSLLGAVLVIILSATIEGFVVYLLPIAAGGFLYIAMSDLIPELRHDNKAKDSIKHVLLIGFGLVLMFGIGQYFGHSHENSHDEHEIIIDEAK